MEINFEINLVFVPFGGGTRYANEAVHHSRSYRMDGRTDGGNSCAWNVPSAWCLSVNYGPASYTPVVIACIHAADLSRSHSDRIHNHPTINARQFRPLMTRVVFFLLGFLPNFVFKRSKKISKVKIVQFFGWKIVKILGWRSKFDDILVL